LKKKQHITIKKWNIFFIISKVLLLLYSTGMDIDLLKKARWQNFNLPRRVEEPV